VAASGEKPVGMTRVSCASRSPDWVRGGGGTLAAASDSRCSTEVAPDGMAK